jgi:ribosomal protection tetracycline resistance protein
VRLGGAVEKTSPQGVLSTIEVVVPADRVHDLQRKLPGLTGGEGSIETTFAGYKPVRGAPPVRRRKRNRRSGP